LSFIYRSSLAQTICGLVWGAVPAFARMDRNIP
jgi:hypothetical protein